tara:strand:+ start:4357 stop:5259 length:903 start_codon:yes stop_codon:yes gene_type:complete
MNHCRPRALIQACRPRQWTKNLLVFAAPLFTFEFGNWSIWFYACFAMVTFCLISSGVYLLNDVLDIKADSEHPVKKFRPIAAGMVTKKEALLISILISVVSLTIAAFISVKLIVIILAYAFIQLGYCFHFKHEPFLDLFCIASGFLLRAIAGGVYLSPWFLLTVGLLSLFLAVEKRKAELKYFQEREVLTRSVLARYSFPVLLRLESFLSSAAFMSYSLWAAGPRLNGASTSWMLLTVPLVLVGLLRYQLLSDPDENKPSSLKYKNHTSENPEEILLGDGFIRLILLGWLLVTTLVGVIA